MLAWIGPSPLTRSGAPIALVAGLLAATSVSPLAAQQPAGAPTATPSEADSVEPAGYRSSIDAAIAEYESGHFAESRALFERAHALQPNARTLRGMGMAEFELRNYPASIYYLEQALGSSVKPLQNELRGETEQLLARARGYVGRITFLLDPPDAVVVMNGTKLSLGADRSVNLVGGDYTLEASAPGHAPERRAIRIASGEQQTLAIQLAKPVALLPPAQPGATQPVAPARDSPSLLESPWLWAAVGVAVIGAGVGIGLAVSGGEETTAAVSGGSSGIALKAP